MFQETAAIAKGRFQRPVRETGKQLRVNDQIRISPVRLIDDNDEQLGVIELDAARLRARDAGLDLVEVAPMARPPVCRIMDYGKWKYQQRKKEQKAKSHAKQSELKEVRVRPKIDDHDLGIKMNKAREFLLDGDKVQFTMLFRGREMAHRDLAYKQMLEMRDELADLSKVEAEPRQMGRRMTMVLVPDRKQKKDKHEGGEKGGEEDSGSDASHAPAPAAKAPRPAPTPA